MRYIISNNRTLVVIEELGDNEKIVSLYNKYYYMDNISNLFDIDELLSKITHMESLIYRNKFLKISRLNMYNYALNRLKILNRCKTIDSLIEDDVSDYSYGYGWLC